VRKPFLPLIVVSFSVSLILFPLYKADSKSATASAKDFLHLPVLSSGYSDESGSEALAASLYSELGLQNMGLKFDALKYAIKGYEYLKIRSLSGNSNILTVIDFSQPSRKKRMYIIDMKKRDVLINTYVAHGKNTGLDYANKFSNIHESLQSSLGFYITKETYFGKHGLSLKLNGMERGYNDNAEERAVVVHGADYIGDHRKGAEYMGRSFGCPAVPQHQSAKVINMIKNGSVLFIYHPSNNYLHGSKILNS